MFEPVERFLQVENLSPGTTYEVKIQYRNSVGLGPANSPYTFTTDEGAPPSPDPETISFYQIEQTSFSLTWADPAPTEDIQYYTVG